MKRTRSGRLSVALRATTLSCLTSLSLVGCGAEGEAGGLAEAADGAESVEVEAVEQLIGSFPGLVTSVKPYAVSLSPEYALQPLLSVGDRVPRSSNPAQAYQMIGIPDGIGTYRASGGATVLYMNHELGNTTTSEPVVGAPLLRGTFVSKYVLDREGRITQGDLAYASVWDENTLVGPPADITNTTPAFARFCSGSLAYREAGFDRPIYFTG